MHTWRHEPPLTGEQPHVPIIHPYPMAELASHIEIAQADTIRLMFWRRKHGFDLYTERFRHMLVHIECQNPAVSGRRYACIALIGYRRAGHLQHSCPRAAGELRGPIG